MRFSHFSVTLLLVLSSFTLPATAAIYHVARGAQGASDDNSGRSATLGSGARGPWKTISHAARVARSGDTVLIYDGDYTDEDSGWGAGKIYIENSGARNARIKFQAAAGNQPVLNTFLVHNRRWITIRGLTFVSRDFSLPAAWRDMPAIVVDDTSVIIDPSEPWSSREQKVRRKFATYMGMQDFFLTRYTNAVDVKSSQHIVIEDNIIRFYTFGIQVRDNSSNIRIEDNHISYCVDGIFSWRPVPSITNSVVRGNVIRQSFNNGVQIREDARSVVVEHNDIRYSGTSHISFLAGTTKSKIRHNSGRFGGYYSETMRFPGSSAINVHTSGSGNVVDSNLAADQIDLTGNDGNGYIADLMRDGAGVLFRNNLAYRNMGSGIRTVESPNCIIVNNTLVENGYNTEDIRDGAGVHFAQDEDINNVVVNNLRPGSAAIDKGARVGWAKRDFDRRSRPRGRGYDIGAFESR